MNCSVHGFRGGSFAPTLLHPRQASKQGQRMIKTIKKLLFTPKIDFSAASRNEPCPCGSGKKYKVCHYNEVRTRQREENHSRQVKNARGR